MSNATSKLTAYCVPDRSESLLMDSWHHCREMGGDRGIKAGEEAREEWVKERDRKSARPFLPGHHGAYIPGL